MMLRFVQAFEHLSGLGLVFGGFPLLVCFAWTLGSFPALFSDLLERSGGTVLSNSAEVGR